MSDDDYVCGVVGSDVDIHSLVSKMYDIYTSIYRWFIEGSMRIDNSYAGPQSELYAMCVAKCLVAIEGCKQTSMDDLSKLKLLRWSSKVKKILAEDFHSSMAVLVIMIHWSWSLLKPISLLHFSNLLAVRLCYYTWRKLLLNPQ